MGSAQSVNARSKPREGNRQTRTAILEAARRVAERDGVTKLSLADVAEEAGFARNTVYGYFRGKNDLVHSVIADDLTAMARAMRGIDWQRPPQPSAIAERDLVLMEFPRAIEEELPLPAESAGDPQEAVGQQVEHPVVALLTNLASPEQVEEEATPLPQVIALPAPEEAAAVVAADEVSANESAAEAEPFAAEQNAIEQPVPVAPIAPTERKTRITRLADIAEALQVPASAQISAEKPKPDAWLERRLRVFERTLNAIEARLEQSERASRATVGTVEENLKRLAERVEAGEVRQRSALAELRGALNEAVFRQQTLEAVTSAALRENAAPVEPAPAEVLSPDLPDEITPADSVAPESEALQPADSFIASARRSAIANAAVAANSNVDNERSNRTRNFIIGAVVLALVLCLAAASKVWFLTTGEAREANRVASIVRPHMTASVPKTARDRLSAFATRHDAKAELLVGLAYLNGSNVAKDETAAAIWLKRAADQGQPVAQYMLGKLNQYGLGVPKDAAQALRWYDAAAVQGNRKAMHQLAIAYAQGLGTPKNASEAARWFSRAAGTGYVDSQFNLAVLYERGEGVPQSLLEAFKWYEIAAAQGDPESTARADVLRTQLGAADLAAAQQAAAAFKPAPVDAAANAVPEQPEISGG